MPTYKLMYFNVTGLAEPIRYMFNYAGIEFEDFRFESEDWPKYKPDMPMGHVPVLEIDGKKYDESRAIGRYLAKKCNLYSSDGIEALEIDAAVDSLEDLRKLAAMYHGQEDPVIKEKLKEVVTEKVPFYFNKFEEQVKKNDGHFVRGKLTWPDIVYAALIDRIHEFASRMLDIDHPELKKLVEKVNAIPSIKAYLEKRPKTKFFFAVKMPTYKLIYFNVTGLAEPIRYMFNYAGIEFEDFRFEIEDWPKYKADMPMGHVPVLEIDGKKYDQSRAISRYLAKKCNLYSDDEIEALEIDAAIDSLEDLRKLVAMYRRQEDPFIKEKLKEIVTEKVPFYFNKFEEQVKKNGGHFVRGKLTWPDIVYAAQIDRIHEFLSQKLDNYHPELKELVGKVCAIPSIKAYLEKCPKTPF
ncbi:PREDICTED: uncharacterized protein LOC106743046 [Dinoponera quadriceps]|uniref:glutathione transferase n=1 Tax=Dinoponera quadriceps TaxID=609295 RepID=A0A6P3X103_DINQU|nr:PREDICTED: uncharacterized protein LOC106743046 [Dinoponera quadriceps]